MSRLEPTPHALGLHLGVDHKKLVMVENQLIEWLAGEFYDDKKIEGCECNIIGKVIELCKDFCTIEELATAAYASGNLLENLMHRAISMREKRKVGGNKKQELN